MSTTQLDKGQISHLLPMWPKRKVDRKNLPEEESGGREDDGQESSCRRLAGDAGWAASGRHGTPRQGDHSAEALQGLRKAVGWGCWVSLLPFTEWEFVSQ